MLEYYISCHFASIDAGKKRDRKKKEKRRREAQLLSSTLHTDELCNCGLPETATLGAGGVCDFKPWLCLVKKISSYRASGLLYNLVWLMRTPFRFM